MKRTDETAHLPRAPQPARSLRSVPWAARVALAAVFALSLAARVLLATAASPTFVSDGRDYRVLARNLAAGRGYVQVYRGETKAFRGFTFRAFRPPGYPVLLAALHSVTGWNDRAYLVVNIAAGCLTQVCFVLIALRLLGVGSALVVQILLATHVLWTPNPMTESVHTALFALLAALIVFGLPLRNWRGALAFGLITVAALFIRPVTICVFPVLVLKLIRGGPTRRRAALALLATLPSVVGVSAWALRNYSLFHQFVPFTTNLGHHNAYDFGIPADWTFSQLRAEGLDEAEINSALLEMEWETAREYPQAWLVTCVQRACQLFSLKPPREVENVLWRRIMRPEESLASRLYLASYWQYAVTYILAACGAAILIMRRRKLNGLGMLFICYVVIHALVSRGDMRLLAPIYPAMCLMAAALWPTGRSAGREQQSHRDRERLGGLNRARSHRGRPQRATRAWGEYLSQDSSMPPWTVESQVAR